MKKIFIIILTILVVASCSLDQKPKNALDRDNAIESAEDAHAFAARMHLGIRSISAGRSVYFQEIATELFQPSNSYGNRNGSTFRWQWQADFDLAESIWSSAYHYINHALFFIEKTQALDFANFTEQEKKNINYDMGLAYFTQAYMGYKLLKYFCNDYSPNAANFAGIPLVYEFNPLPADQTTYPGRDNLQNSYDWVMENLDLSRGFLTDSLGVEGSSMLTVDVVDALWARIALDMGDYATAANKATSLIDGGKYPLLTTTAAMKELWTNDSGKECIMQMYADLAAQSIPNSNDPGYYAKQSNGKYQPDWILAAGVADLYSSSDIRTIWFDKNIEITQGDYKGKATLFNKFPGNLTLQSATAQSNHLQKVKPFRIAEQYLIAAEAYAMQGGSFETEANKYYNLLMKSRVSGWQDASLSGNELIKAIRDERLKEFIGEGFRFFDLRRWGEGMKRTYQMQDSQLIATGGADGTALTLTVDANDYRWLLPIPRYEIDANPQIREQQNPGY